MPVKVLSASAGSGKTFNLSMFYIKLAMEDADNFKKILAITFTNAAANEMKNRILTRLFDLSKGKGIDEYRKYAAVDKNISNKEITKRAGEVLNRIVHHYYDFSVSTIDSFLQRFFKGVLYEIGLRTNYELVVNNEEVIEQAVNDFLLNLDKQQDQAAFEWLIKFIKNNVQDNKSSNYINQLIQLTHEINKEFFYSYEKKFAKLNKNNFDALVETLETTINTIIDEAKNFQQEFDVLCEKSGFYENDFYQKSKGAASYLGSKLKRFINEKSSISLFNLNNQYLDDALNKGKWLVNNENNKEIVKKFIKYKSSFQKLLSEFVDFIRTVGKQYEDSRIILKQLFNISILNLIVHNINEYKKNNNVLLLSDIGKLLKDFIPNNYLFIYEKLGIRYEYFLIDEFQDTSCIQYQVLKPLIENSISDKINESVLLVGDVKQAIYRWRNGNWELMNSTIYKDFAQNINKQTLEYNWRSYPVIIYFNNALMKHLVKMNNLFKNDKRNIYKIYEDVEQKFPKDKNLGEMKGYVKLIAQKTHLKSKTLTDHDNDSEDDSEDLKWIADEVNRLWIAGYKNIGIIVRKNIEASLIFDYLMNNVKIDDDDFKVISKESITYVNSNAVMWIIFTLYYIQNNSSYALYMAKEFFKKLNSFTDADAYFDELKNNTAFKTKNLYYRTEYLISSLYKHINQREKTFCIHFLQLLKNYLDENPISEVKFIDWFLKKGMGESIKISGEKKGIHIVTIHKSKGLEYDAVIVPFVNWTKTPTNYLWFKKPKWIKNSSIPAFLFKKNKEQLFSNFEQEYLQEQNNLIIDDLNLLYVAFTRAKKILIAGIEQKNIGIEISKLLETNFKMDGLDKNISDYKTLENDKITIYELGEFKNNDEQYNEIETEQFDIYMAPKPITLNLVFKGNEELSSQKSIAHGLLIHAIMEQITDIEQWKVVAQKIMTAFNVTEQDKQHIYESIDKIFQKHTQIIHWFTEAKKIISERKIIFQKKLYRPDKIFVHNDKVILVDFKTGETELDKYKNQVKKYKTMLMALNYCNIESYLLNIDTNELVLVE